MTNKNNLQKITDEFFSSDKVISYYSKPGLHLSEKKLFKRYLFRKGNVLDLCCGAGRTAFPLAKLGFNVIGVDKNPDMIKMAKKLEKKFKFKNIKFYCNDASKIKFKENQFDYVLVMENSIECIPSKEEREKVFKNIYNYLKNGGLFITSFNSCFHPKIAIKLFFHNIVHTFNTIVFSSSDQLDINDIILRVSEESDEGLKVKLEKTKLLYFHFFTPFEIKKIIKEAGFSSFEKKSINELGWRKNKFKNLEIYKYMRVFLYSFIIAKK